MGSLFEKLENIGNEITAKLQFYGDSLTESLNGSIDELGVSINNSLDSLKNENFVSNAIGDNRASIQGIESSRHVIDLKKD